MAFENYQDIRVGDVIEASRWSRSRGRCDGLSQQAWLEFQGRVHDPPLLFFSALTKACDALRRTAGARQAGRLDRPLNSGKIGNSVAIATEL